ncbi:MAG: T9SS type A sorting domain-containing protein [Bacteroidota bacterium]
MKKQYLLLFCSALIGSTFGQTFSDNFDSYAVGDNLAAKSAVWETWSGPNGGADDVKVTNAKAKSGSNSIYFQSTAANGGPADVVLPFGGMRTNGQFSLKMAMNVDAGKNAYFNFQEQTTVGKGYTIDVYFMEDKTLNINNAAAGNLLSVSYPQGQWFEFELKVDLNTNTWDLYIDGTKVGAFQNATRALASMDLFPINGSSFYVDDVSYSYTAYTSTTKNASVTYIDNVIGFLAGANVIPSVEIRNLGTTTITEAEISIKYNGNTLTKKLTGINLAANGLYSTKFDNALSIVGGSGDVVASIVTVNGGKDDNANDDSKTITINPIVPAKGKMVIGEEATGTWCQWCPRGAVALKTMHDKYDGFFQGIAVHNNDPMENPYYDAAIASKISGYPSALVDRGTKMDPSAMGGDFIKRIQIAPKGVMDIAAKYDAVTKIMSVSVETTIQSDISGDFRIACAIVEDDVTGTTSGYNQSNAYAGGGSGVMGGYEKLPNPVPASQMVYDHVGRLIAPTFAGLPNAFGASATAGQKFVHNFSFEMEPSWEMMQMHIVPMFIDKNGMIDNGGSLPFIDARNKAFKDGTAVLASQALNGPDTRIALQPNPSDKQFEIALFGVINGQSSLEIVDMQGKVVYQSQQLSGKMTIPSQDWSAGVYLVRLNENGQIFQKKFIKN